MLNLLEITQASSILYPRDLKCMSLSCPQRSASFPSLVSSTIYWGLLESPSNFYVSEAQTMSWAELSEHSAKHTFVSPSLCTALPWILSVLPENMGAPQTETWWGTLWGELLSPSASLPHLLTSVLFQGLLAVTRECMRLHFHPQYTQGCGCRKQGRQHIPVTLSLEGGDRKACAKVTLGYIQGLGPV